MGKHSRTKGRSFEQLVATAYRETWPQDVTVVRRSLQADRAYEPDVVVEGHPLGSRFWTECNHADDPQPLVKLAQAERDIKACKGTPPAKGWIPLVVWRKSGSRTIHVTTRMWVLQELGGHPGRMEGWSDLVVTLDWVPFLAALGA